MFESLDLRGRTLRGRTASIVWAYHAAAVLDAWTVAKRTDETTRAISWTLHARLGSSVDRFKLRQRPLALAVPRAGGFWYWPIRELAVGEQTVSATLGPPEI